jgi:hypothetical protein
VTAGFAIITTAGLDTQANRRCMGFTAYAFFMAG